MKQLKLGCFFIAVAIIVVLAFTVYRVVDRVDNAYAMWAAAEHVNDHLAATNGRWPRSWTELQSVPSRNGTKFDAEHWADMQKRVDVDWNADVEALRAAPEPKDAQPPFRVIWLKAGQSTAATDPNLLVWQFLHPSSTQPSTPPATQPATLPAAR